MQIDGPRRGPSGFLSFPGAPDLEVATRDLPVGWLAWRSTLLPRWGRLRANLAWTALMTLLGPLAMVALAPLGLPPAARWGAAVAAGLWSGFWWHALLLHRHEGAHFLLHPERRRNDRRADLLCLWAFDRIDRYRHRHWLHHACLGRPDDPEGAYFRAAHPGRLFLSFLGGAFVADLRLHLGHPPRHPRLPPPADGPGTRAWILVRGLAAHLAVLALLHAAGGPPAALTWLVAAVLVQPGLGRLRGMLEHRRLEADPMVDFSLLPHGPANRLFEGGWFSRWLGAAGHRHHLLHHWDPSVSYTRLPEVADYLARTDLGQELERHRATYGATLAALVRRAARRPPPELDGV